MKSPAMNKKPNDVPILYDATALLLRRLTLERYGLKKRKEVVLPTRLCSVFGWLLHTLEVGGSSLPPPTIQNRFRTTCLGNDREGYVKVSFGYPSIFNINTLKHRFTEQALFIVIALLDMNPSSRALIGYNPFSLFD